MEYIKNPFDFNQTKKLVLELNELGLYDYSAVKCVQNLDKPLFLQEDLEEQFLWDMNYFLFKNFISIYDLVYEIGNFYFANTKNEVNIPLVATIAAKIFLTQKTFENTVLKMREIQNKNNFSNIKFFSCEEDKNKVQKVQIMTLHKSKGDEFDYVFIPELTKNNICFSMDGFELKENTKFIQKIKKEPKTEDELKREIIEENFRLIYVGITRAKKKLFLSTSDEYKYFGKLKKLEHSEIFDGLCEVKKC